MTLIPHGDTLDALRLQGISSDPTDHGYFACPHRDGRFVQRGHCPQRCDPAWAPCVAHVPDPDSAALDVPTETSKASDGKAIAPLAVEPTPPASGPKRVPLADLDGGRVHPAADAFPLLGETDLQALADSIREHGQQQPLVVTWDEESGERILLDGRNRLAACRLAGIDPIVEEWGGTGDPTDWVLSINLDRRHLTTSQRAAVAVGLMPLLSEQARQRQAEAGRATAAGELPEFFPEAGEAREQAARQVGTNSRYVADACKIADAAPKLLALVRAGTLGIQDAKRALKLDDDARAEVVEKATDVDPSDEDAVKALRKAIRGALKAARGKPEQEPAANDQPLDEPDDGADLAQVEAAARRLPPDAIRALIATLTSLLRDSEAT